MDEKSNQPPLHPDAQKRSPRGEDLVDWDLEPQGLPFRWRGDQAETRRNLSPVRAYPAGDDPRLAPGYQSGIVPDSSRTKGRKPREAKLPGWIRGAYRPRHLTNAGRAALEFLSPGNGGLCGYPKMNIPTMEDHRDMLALRYTAWDLIGLGQAMEVLGTYHNLRRLPDLPAFEMRLRRPFHGRDPFLDGALLLRWLASVRQMTVDQALALEPARWNENLGTLLALEEEGAIERVRVRLGLGSLQVCQLTPEGRRYVAERWPDLPSLGCGPRMPQHLVTTDVRFDHDAGLAALHPLLIVDALGWCVHEYDNLGLGPEQIVTEAALAGPLGHGQDAWRPDFELRPNPGLPIGVEVIGTGSTYRSKGRMWWTKRSPYFKTFSGSDRSPSFGKHVVIGR